MRRSGGWDTRGDEMTAHGFRAPTPAELSRLRQTRLRLARGRGGETLEELVARTRSAWKPDMVAVANGLAVSSRLSEGELVKIAVSEPYVARRGRRQGLGGAPG